jgi:hypothetical protein
LPAGAFSARRTSTPQRLALDIGAFVRQLAREGKIPAGKVGRSWRFSRRALLRLVGEHDD